jgi:hypothetical protein
MSTKGTWLLGPSVQDSPFALRERGRDQLGWAAESPRGIRVPGKSSACLRNVRSTQKRAGKPTLLDLAFGP